jgi:hypothetical protein
MLDVRRWLRQIGATLGSTFAGTWAAIASLAEALDVDVAAGKQVLIAALAAGFAAVSAAVGNWIRQARELAAEAVADLENVHFD